MLRYSKANLGLFFLSPYVVYNFYETQTVFYNRLVETEIVLTIPSEKGHRLVEELTHGIEQNKLFNMINGWRDGLNSQEIINTLIRNRVIE